MHIGSRYTLGSPEEDPVFRACRGFLWRIGAEFGRPELKKERYEG